MKNIEIQNGMVMICGPTTSGKTTLARKILDEAPYQDKILVSHDEMLEEFIQEHNLPKSTLNVGIDGSLENDFSIKVFRKIRDALQCRSFVIFEGVYCEPQQLDTLVPAFIVWGLDRPLTLLKMWPSIATHTKFAEKRPNKELFDMHVLMTQRLAFRTQVGTRRYSEDYHFVREYTIDDPRKLAISYKKPRELSKELMAAYEAREECIEYVPQFVRDVANY